MSHWKSDRVWAALLLVGTAALSLWLAACGVQVSHRMSAFQATGEVMSIGGGHRYTEPAHKQEKPAGVGMPQDELWVIVKPPEDQVRHESAPVADDTPGTGALVVSPPDGQPVPMPVQHTEVKAKVIGHIATVDVTQQFSNPYDGKIEAVYVFPLPQDAAVNQFVMTIGDRRIRGVLRPRAEAERIYHEARRQGHVVSMMTQERPNIFRQKVGNIEPRKRIDVSIRYFHTLRFADGEYEFVFPMVVGPRFNPPGTSDGIGEVARGSRGASDQATEGSYLRPGMRSGHDINLSVEIEAGLVIESMNSVNHQTTTRRREGERATVALVPHDRIPNKDFVLRIGVAGDSMKSTLITHRDDRGGYFTLMLIPPRELGELPRQPMEMIFVLDCSGSMSGPPIEQAKRAVGHALGALRPPDTFQIIQFSDGASQLGSRPLFATQENVRNGLHYVESLHGSGGTMMTEGIRTALEFEHAPERLRFVTFLTDGYIGNEREVLGEVYRRLGQSRIFSFGVGQSPNRYLMDRMARLGQGTVAYLSLNNDSADTMDRFFERVSHPALSNISVDWGEMQVHDLRPSRVPDLFVGRPVTLTGRFGGSGRTVVRVTGHAGGRPITVDIPMDLDDAATHPALPIIWARNQIAELHDRTTYEHNDALPQQIEQLALDYQLMSAYTTFVAVDAQSHTADSYGTTVHQRVPVPEGVRYETTVTE